MLEAVSKYAFWLGFLQTCEKLEAAPEKLAQVALKLFEPLNSTERLLRAFRPGLDRIDLRDAAFIGQQDNLSPPEVVAHAA